MDTIAMIGSPASREAVASVAFAGRAWAGALPRGAAMAGAVSAAAAVIASVIAAMDARLSISVGAQKPAARWRVDRALVNRCVMLG
jgi:hypothetical protein